MANDVEHLFMVDHYSRLGIIQLSWGAVMRSGHVTVDSEAQDADFKSSDVQK